MYILNYFFDFVKTSYFIYYIYKEKKNRKNMKKIKITLLALIITLTFASCTTGNSNKPIENIDSTCVEVDTIVVKLDSCSKVDNFTEKCSKH